MGAGLVIEQVYAAYDRADVLEGVSLTVEPGHISCLLGANGAGKTTLIRGRRRDRCTRPSSPCSLKRQ